MPARAGDVVQTWRLRAAESRAKERAQIEERLFRSFVRRSGRVVRAERDALHVVANAAVDEAAQLIQRVVGAASRRIRVERIGHAQIVARPSEGDVHEASLFFGLLIAVETAGGRKPAVDRPDDEYRIPLLALGGGLYRPNAADSQAAAIIESIAARAVASPIPGSSINRRYQLTSSRGFSRIRRNASTSLTCAASRNLRPPHFSNGIFRFVSSISRSADM